MCYGSCKYERNDGECKNVGKFPKFIGAACNTNFECTQCESECTEEQAVEGKDICCECDRENKIDEYADSLAFNRSIAKSDELDASIKI